jgi:hypothetical protein
LKKAIAYLIANDDLPFLFVERKFFCNLMCLLNAQVRPGNLLFSRKTITMEVHYLHKSHSQIIKMMFEKIKHIGFTLDAWMSPNTIAFLGITAHAITTKWELIDIVVAMTQVHGQSMLSKFMVPFF